MALAPNVDVYAAAVVPNAGASGNLSVNTGHFASAFVRSAAGVVVVSLLADQGVDPADRALLLTPFLNGAGAATFAVIDPASTDTAITVRTFDAAGAPADAPFAIAVLKKRLG